MPFFVCEGKVNNVIKLPILTEHAKLNSLIAFTLLRSWRKDGTANAFGFPHLVAHILSLVPGLLTRKVRSDRRKSFLKQKSRKHEWCS